MYINTVTKQYPIEEGEIRTLFNPTNLPSELTPTFLASIGYAKVIVESENNFPKKPWETLIAKQPEKVGSLWIQGWEVIPLSLAEKKEKMLKHFNEIFNVLISQVKNSYPPTEVESWAKQEKEARDYLNNPSCEAFIVRAIASARGLEVSDLANRIISKADAYAHYVGNLIGTRQMLEDLIDNATEANIDSIKWPPD